MWTQIIIFIIAASITAAAMQQLNERLQSWDEGRVGRQLWRRRRREDGVLLWWLGPFNFDAPASEVIGGAVWCVIAAVVLWSWLT